MAKYPLEALARVREWEAEQAARALDEAGRARAAAAAGRRLAEQRRDEHARAAALLVRGEDAALARGELRGRDLDRASMWASAVAEERRGLDRDVETARVAEAAAIADEERARARGVATNAGAELLAGHRDRWTSAQRTAVERKEEDLSLDAWRGLR
jgi:hypothetical protein